MSPVSRIALLTCLSLLAGMAWSDALAASACVGTLRASMVHPLPKPLTLGAARTIADSPNPGLVRRFVAGLQQAGITVVEEGAAATLSIAVSVTAPAGSPGLTSGFYKGFEWTSGEQIGTSGGVPGIRSTALSISAVVADNKAITQSWVGTIDCRVQTDDPGELAEFIGKSIGLAMGKDVDRKGV